MKTKQEFAMTILAAFLAIQISELFKAIGMLIAAWVFP